MAIDADLVARIVSDVMARLKVDAEPSEDAPSPAGDVSPSVRDAAARSERPLAIRDIPFVDPDLQPGDKPFADVGGKSGVDDPARMLDGWTRPVGGGLQLQAAINGYQTLSAALLQTLAERRRAVAIVRCEGENYRGDIGTWSGTGFLVAPNILLTNNHVIDRYDIAQTARVGFGHELSPEQLIAGDGRTPPAQYFRLDPARLFLTSPTIKGLDYTFVWIDEAASKAHGVIPMMRSSFTSDELKGDQAIVIHHPDGRPKEVSLDDADILGVTSLVLHYASDTMVGSSGSPVFDRRGRLIALHHASREATFDLPDGGQTDRVNEGVKLAAITIDLENRAKAGGDEASFAEIVLREISGSDTLVGFFGAAGRRTSSGATAPEAVVETYRGADQDVDIGFWNIEWLANRWGDQKKLDGAARVIADLRLDAWGLSEVSPAAVKALVERLEDTYGERYAYALSEPDAPSSRQTTAMIWKTNFLSGEQVPWPRDVEPLFRKRSDDPNLDLEAVDGKIFDRYPALYRFRTSAPGMKQYAFYVVPLHLKAKDEGSLRRRLAARILARAVKALVAEHGLDVILGGDMNAPLASGDFQAIEDGGFALLGAQDERDGAFTYVKGPKSSIDNVFLSPGMSQTVGKADYFIIAKDRTMPDYLDISDHRPIAVRLSLGASARPAPPTRGASDLDAMIDALASEPDGTTSPAPRPRRNGRRTPGDRPHV